MSPIFTLISKTPYIEFPHNLAGWFSFILLLGLVFYLLWRWKGLNRLSGKYHQRLLLILLIAAPIAGSFIGVKLPASGILIPPEATFDTTTNVLMLFAAIPFMLASGTLGPAIAAGIAVLSYLPLAAWSTHSVYTLFESALMAILISGALRQSYRTRIFQAFRNPLITGLLAVIAYPVIHFFIVTMTVGGEIVSRMDFAQSNLVSATTSSGIELVIAAFFVYTMKRISPTAWKGVKPDLPTPAERSLQTRFLANMTPLAAVLFISLALGDWYFAGEAASRMLRARLENAAEISAESISYFLETGQNLAAHLADDQRLLSTNSSVLQTTLADSIQVFPFFSQLMILDLTGQVIAEYRLQNYPNLPLSNLELQGISLTTIGVPQYFSLKPGDGQNTAQVSFMTAIYDQNKVAQRILVARCDLESNPLSKSILSSLDNLNDDDVQGMLLDEYGNILVHPNPSQVMQKFSGKLSETPDYYQTTAPDGTRSYVLFQPAVGRSWYVVLTVPALRAQQLALDIAAPLLVVIIVLAVIAVVVSRLTLRNVTASLQNLTAEADRLAQGELDRPFEVTGIDEVGQLRKAFDQMRLSLKERLDELHQLLLVSQGVASSLEVTEAIQPVLEAILARGATFARVILMPSVVQEIDSDPTLPIRFGLGPQQEVYHDLDEQILALTRQQDRLVLSNVMRPRLLNIPTDTPPLASLMAVALRHENQYFGAMWVAYDKPHTFLPDEVRFLVTLAGQAALATANARLFLNAEIGRQRLAAILASSPDPVLVTDQRNRLLLANPAAWQVLDLGMNASEGENIDQVIHFPEIVDMLRAPSAEKQTKEITLPDGRVYSASATAVIAEGQRVGRVCVLRDVTHFKELDALKSDFVSTVSHDLRSPLTLMRGYASMLEMVGELNETQDGYVKKIVSGVESMSRLVNNLLDLGRIEAGIGLQLEMTPLQEIVERVVGGLQLQAAQKRIQILTETPSQGIPLIEADPALLQQALHNLVENAIKYTRSDGKVLVKLQPGSNSVIFEVIDNGIGVSPMDIPHLFEKFYRGAQQGSKEQRGSGLGLAIVKSICDRHGGRVWADSKLGKGSNFRMEIPVRQPEAEEKQGRLKLFKR